MSLAVSTNVPSLGYVTYNGVNLFSKEKLEVKIAPMWETIHAALFGPVDKYKKDCTGKFSFRLWGAYENLSTIIPNYLTNPIPGTQIFGAASQPLVILARNNDKLTLVNAAITKMSNLYLGVDSDLFAADIEFTWVIGRDGSGNYLAPETASSYTTRGTGSYSDATAAFAKTNFVRTRFTSAWGSITGFTSMVAKKGISVDWAEELAANTVDGYGTVDFSVKSMIASAKLIPLGPSLAQMKTNSQEETAHGTLASAISGDLVMTGNNSGPVITLKNAHLKENGEVFDDTEIRMGEATWETTRGFSAGTPAIVASAA